MKINRLLIGWFALVSGTLAQSVDRPNILVVVADDHRQNLIGKYHDIIQTPTLDDLCNSGVYFNNAYVTTPICAASRASILTGLTERTHGYTFGESAVPAQFTATAYPKMLKDNGYRTGFVGKYGCKLSGAHSERFDSFNSRSQRINETYNGQSIPQTYYIANKARDFIADAEINHAGTPWCMSVSFWNPHAHDSDLADQYHYPPEFETLYDDVTIPAARVSDAATFNALPGFIKTSISRTRWGWRYDTPEKYQRMVKRHYRAITAVDKGVQMIRDKLTELGIADNTVIIYIGDNGYTMNERQLAGKWLGWEECLRVPLIIYDPRSNALHGVELDQTSLNIDLAPTMMEMAGIEIPAMYQGRSLYPLLGGEDPLWRNEFFFEHYYAAGGQIPRNEGVRTKQWKYVNFTVDTYEQLYDLQADPGEMINLAADAAYADVLAHMRNSSSAYIDLYSDWPYMEPEWGVGNSAVYIDNTDSGLTYSGSWALISDFSEDYNGSMHYAAAAGESVEYTFEGDSVQVGIRKGASGGICDVYLDGVLVANDVDTYASAKIGQVIVYEAALAAGTHTIKLEATGTKNPRSGASNLMFDFFHYTVPSVYADNDSDVVYSGTWARQENESDFSGSMHWADDAGESVEYAFEGTAVKVAVRKGGSGGICKVYVDGFLVADQIDTYASVPQYQTVIYEAALPPGSHTVKLEATGSKNPAANNSNIMFDYFQYGSSEPQPPTFTDNDSDGLPDCWEVLNLETLAQNATDDGDQDRLSNYGEYIAGTHPKNAASRFDVNSLSHEPGGSITLKWDSAVRRTYTVLKSIDLTANDWVIYSDLSGSGLELVFSDPVNAETNAFYKIQVTRP